MRRLACVPILVGVLLVHLWLLEVQLVFRFFGHIIIFGDVLTLLVLRTDILGGLFLLLAHFSGFIHCLGQKFVREEVYCLLLILYILLVPLLAGLSLFILSSCCLQVSSAVCVHNLNNAQTKMMKKPHRIPNISWVGVLFFLGQGQTAFS